MSLRSWLRSLERGASYITLDPSPRLRRLRKQQGAEIARRHTGPLPPLPESAYSAEGALLEPQTWPPEEDAR
jgi:hypothetical protein